jgi:beta-lactamase regulating signal transducer with metallopeptidase domain
MEDALRFVFGLSLAGGATCVLVYALGISFRKLVKKTWLLYLWLVVLLRFMVPVPLNIPYVTDGLSALTAVLAPASPPEANGSGIAPDTANAVNPDDTKPALSGDAITGDTITGDTITSNVDTGDAVTGDAVTGDALPADTITADAAETVTAGKAAGSAAAVNSNTPGVQTGFSLLTLLPYLWLAGALALFIRTIVGYALTLARLRRGRSLLRPGRVPVYESGRITSPLLTGLLRPAVYLPEGFPHPELAIRHELTHCRRGDLWLKWLAQLVVCVHWFNPLAWLMKRELGRLCELACDNAIVRRLGQPERLGYGQMLLDTAHAVADKSGLLVASLGRDKRYLAERIVEIAVTRRTTKKAAAAISLLTAVILTAAVVFGVFLSACTSAPAASDEQTVSPSPAVSGNPFVNDPEVPGTWKAVTEVRNTEDFDPVNHSYSDYPEDESGILVFAEDGKMSSEVLSWSKGVISVANSSVTFGYDIQVINGQIYMFIVKSAPDQAGSYLVLKRVSDETDITIATDDINLTFVNDPAVIGTWEPFCLAKTVSDFVPGETLKFSAYSLVFASGGSMSAPNETWTKGAVLVADNDTALDYIIREIDGLKYLFLERPDGYPVDFLGKTYGYYVYKWASENVEFELYTDDIDLPFVDDPAVLGTWRYVSNAVSSQSTIVPKGLSVGSYDASRPFFSDYANTEMTFSSDGALKETLARGGSQPASRELTWTKGVVIDPYCKTASAYELREISGITYLFMESKDEGYYRSKPENRLGQQYTVWIRSPEPVDFSLPEGAPPGFVDDPALVGTWMPYGLAKNDFEFATMWREGYALVAYDNGWTNEPNMTWSKGSLTLTGNYEAEDLVRGYVIRETGGRRFLYIKGLPSSAAYLDASSIDYQYTVYLWVSDPVPYTVYTDDIDLPFVNDPAVIGDWKPAASVRSIDDYKPPASPQYITYLPDKTMTFSEGGTLGLETAGTPAPAGFTWTNGTVIDPYLKTASAYVLKDIDGVTYLFMENKDTPNYTHLHVIGGYTVWTKIN